MLCCVGLYISLTVSPERQPLKFSEMIELAPPTLSNPEGREDGAKREAGTPLTVRVRLWMHRGRVNKRQSTDLHLTHHTHTPSHSHRLTH